MRESPAEVRLTSLRLLFQTLWKLKQTSTPRLHLVHVFKTALQPQQLLTKVDGGKRKGALAVTLCSVLPWQRVEAEGETERKSW